MKGAHPEVRRFKRPTYTQIPNEILRELMPTLSGSEFKVICFIATETIGWQNFDQCKALTIDTIEEGTGLSRNTVLGALNGKDGLIQRGLLHVEKGPTSRTTHAYRILVEDEVSIGADIEPIAAAFGSKSEPELVQKLHRPIRKKEILKKPPSPTPPPLEAIAATSRDPEEEDSVLTVIHEHIAAAGADVAPRLIGACRQIDPGITGDRVARLVRASVSRGARIHSAGYFLTAVPKLVNTPVDRPDSPPDAHCSACGNSGMLAYPDRFCSCQSGAERHAAAASFTPDDWAEMTAEGNVNRDRYLPQLRALEIKSRAENTPLIPLLHPSISKSDSPLPARCATADQCGAEAAL